MSNKRCSICRQSKTTLKKLKSHLMARHSKLQIVKSILKKDAFCVIRSAFPPKSRWYFKHANKVAGRKNNVNNEDLNCATAKILTPPSEEYSVDLKYNCTEEQKINLPKTGIQESQCSITLEETLVKVQDSKNFLTDATTNIEVNNSNFVFKLDNEDVTENVEIEGAYFKTEDISLNYKVAESHFGIEELNSQTLKKEVKSTESDTESCSDNGKNLLSQYVDQRLYCSVCGNGYVSEYKLLQHLRIHQIECRICCQTFNDSEIYREHIKQHTIKVFACYVCTNEFLHKKNLINHLNMHYEQEVLESVLDMELDYNISNSCMYHIDSINHINDCDYISKINQIKQYLGINDQYFYKRYNCNNNNNVYAKVICDICYQEMYLYEYQKHLKYMHSHHFTNTYY